jgi:hypothetical protein
MITTTMALNTRVYNSDLLKGTGLIQETMVLIDLFREGMTKQELIDQVLEFNPLAKEHENRTKDIVNRVFQGRFLKEGGEVVLEIQQLRNGYVSLEIISQIIFIYTCRANLILFDFVKDIFQPLAKSGNPLLPEKAAVYFIEEAIRDGRIPTRWSDSTKRRVARHINACLIDFKLIDNSKRTIPFFINDVTAHYWIHKQHFNGLSDAAIMSLDEWNLFGLNQQDVIGILARLSLAGHFVLQQSGELIRVTWKYQSMKEFIDGITKQ